MRSIRFAALSALTLPALLLAAPAQAQSPVQIALVAPSLQLVSADSDVSGLRLSLYGRNANMTGLDIGLIAQTTGDFKGIQWGLAGISEGDHTGLQWNTVSVTQGLMKGMQLGLVNSAESGEGIQWGGFNHSSNFEGLQVAFVNYAETINGLQIGLINIIREGGLFPVLPIINFGSN